MIVANLERLRRARGRANFLESALAAGDETGANFFMNMAQTLSGYNDRVAPIEEITILAGLTMARAENGRALIPFPLDHGVWTERASQITNYLVTNYRSPGFRGGFDLWVTGTVSPLAHQELARIGITVTANVDEHFGMFD